MAHCSKKASRWYRGLLDAAERFMVKWHGDEAKLRRQRRASVVGGAQGNRGEGGQQKEWKETRPREWGQGGQQEE